jgi:hypothetical protein
LVEEEAGGEFAEKVGLEVACRKLGDGDVRRPGHRLGERGTAAVTACVVIELSARQPMLAAVVTDFLVGGQTVGEQRRRGDQLEDRRGRKELGIGKPIRLGCGCHCVNRGEDSTVLGIHGHDFGERRPVRCEQRLHRPLQLRDQGELRLGVVPCGSVLFLVVQVAVTRLVEVGVGEQSAKPRERLLLLCAFDCRRRRCLGQREHEKGVQGGHFATPS